MSSPHPAGVGRGAPPPPPPPAASSPPQSDSQLLPGTPPQANSPHFPGAPQLPPPPRGHSQAGNTASVHNIQCVLPGATHQQTQPGPSMSPALVMDASDSGGESERASRDARLGLQQGDPGSPQSKIPVVMSVTRSEVSSGRPGLPSQPSTQAYTAHSSNAKYTEFTMHFARSDTGTGQTATSLLELLDQAGTPSSRSQGAKSKQSLATSGASVTGFLTHSQSASSFAKHPGRRHNKKRSMSQGEGEGSQGSRGSLYALAKPPGEGGDRVPLRTMSTTSPGSKAGESPRTRADRHPLRRVSEITHSIHGAEGTTSVGGQSRVGSTRLQRWFYKNDVRLRDRLVTAVLPMGLLPIALYVLCIVRPEWVESNVWIGAVAGGVGAVLAASIVLISWLLEAVNLHQRSLRRELELRREVEDAVSAFIPAEFLALLNYHNVTEVRVGQHTTTKAAIMFTDIRDFTALTQERSGEETFRWLNSFLARVVPCIRANKGFVDKYLGDGILAIFPQPAVAVAAGIQMQRIIDDEFVNDLVFVGGEVREGQLRMGVGIHYGEVVVGTVGDPERIDTTIISDVVNMASRIESLTKYYASRTLVSMDAVRAIDLSGVCVRPVGAVKVKGSNSALPVYDIFEADSPDVREHKLNSLSAFLQGLDHYKEARFDDAIAVWEASQEQVQREQEGDEKWHDEAVTTKLRFARLYRERGKPSSSWQGEDVWDIK